VLTQYRKTAQHPDLPEMSALQFDQQAFLLPLVKSEVAKAIAKTGDVDTFTQEGLTLLNQSNGQLRGDSASSSIYEAFLVTILRRTLGQKLDPALLAEYVERCPSWSSFVGHVLKDQPHDMLPAEERDYDSFILTSFAEAIKDVRLALKTDDSKHWNWKTLHQIDFFKGSERFTVTLPEFLATIFSPQKIGVGGDQDCINNCNYDLNGLPAAFNCTSGPTVRTLMDLSDPDKFYQTLSLGQSEHLLSNHRTDQLRSWLDGELHPIAFSEKQLEKQLQHTLILTNHE
jgi:penicillin amidase